MRKTPAVFAVVALTALISTAGCSASTPKPAVGPRFAPVVFSGTVDGDKTFIVPKGARSATISVVCGGEGFFGLDGALNKDQSGLNGGCGYGSHRYNLAVAGGEALDLHMKVTKNGSFVVETRFSPDRFVANAELAAQCAEMIAVGSDVFNAEDGFTRGALTLAHWKQQMAGAAAALRPVLSDKANVVTAPLKTIEDALVAPGIAPGAFDGPSNYTNAMSIVNQVCSDNGDALYVNAEYGG